LQDVEEAGDKISQSLLQRLVLKPQKIQQLADGIRAIAAEEEPIRRVLSRMEVAEGVRIQHIICQLCLAWLHASKQQDLVLACVGR
jgi:delta-1-pyrroline-5-carboxylate synthetase